MPDNQGARLREIAIELAETQRGFADLIGERESVLSRYINGLPIGEALIRKMRGKVGKKYIDYVLFGYPIEDETELDALKREYELRFQEMYNEIKILKGIIARKLEDSD